MFKIQLKPTLVHTLRRDNVQTVVLEGRIEEKQTRGSKRMKMLDDIMRVNYQNTKLRLDHSDHKNVSL